MQYITKLKLAAMHQWCDTNDKSTEYLIQFLQDTCKVNHDTVINYLQLGEKEHSKLFREVMELSMLIATNCE